MRISFPHISDTQIVFYQREDEVIIAAGVFHTWRNFISPKYAHMTKCVQCNQCALVCPTPPSVPCCWTRVSSRMLPPASRPGKPPVSAQYQYRMQVSPYDCTGLRQLRQCLPAKEKALVMQPAGEPALPDGELGNTPWRASP